MSLDRKRRCRRDLKPIDIELEIRMLRGNMARMRMTDDPVELQEMYAWASARIYNMGVAIDTLKDEKQNEIERGDSLGRIHER